MVIHPNVNLCENKTCRMPCFSSFMLGREKDGDIELLYYELEHDNEQLYDAKNYIRADKMKQNGRPNSISKCRFSFI